ncbi:MAG: HupE/UreJ family protein [Methylovulum sp.]|uniref:HupE/UreJ family protein n=1 Tax=Methylovulum sp. TaxID=1916980 RepID=UPI002631DA01|nr:HupE/UreJ family protein [Methylovulum sp.]MDD2722416.1 HupE/UreJ family protein [Methylovulum sp.]MDD5125611.1 HupE/UreJ family protein [Methylovulum sp.]
MKAKFSHSWLGLIVYAAVMPSAEAHTFGAYDAGLLAGLAHPFMGLDHLLAMIAVGIWAAQLGGRAVWLVPLTFVSVMSAAAALGSVGLPLPFLEPVVASSVLVLGLLIAGPVRLPAGAGAALAALFAVFHGYAHGLELPQAATPIFYGIGFVLATILLHGVGIGFALSLRQYKIIQRIAGYALVAASGLLLVAV